ncbi:iron ABC transporter ATP-binding protein [Eubacteriales bacterium]|nr:ABC transporter ATP-binding protein [Faecalicatena sp. BF-R-105]GKH49952.1 iron ABC transporter ATP-binding protein [Eubacteriales bacterium]GKH62588.1 iron ABC transporter ATP-binding protein [Eubacteriales bacterium]
MNFSIQNGCFGYGSTPILHNISFDVESREILTVLGPNGVGKTTLLRCMMGLLHWRSGNTLLDGIPITKMNHAEVWRRISYVPQSKGTALSYTAAEMVLMGRSARLGLFTQPTAEDRQRAAEAMDQVGITHLANKKCSEMSGGELQMVLIARALSTEPELLVLDEPESNLDFKNQLIILETISRLSHERGIAAIVNTHYPAHALKIADKALILNRDGQSLCGPAAETINEENMRRAFSVQVKIEDYRYEGRCYKSVIPLAVVS